MRPGGRPLSGRAPPKWHRAPRGIHGWSRAIQACGGRCREGKRCLNMRRAHEGLELGASRRASLRGAHSGASGGCERKAVRVRVRVRGWVRLGPQGAASGRRLRQTLVCFESGPRTRMARGAHPPPGRWARLGVAHCRPCPRRLPRGPSPPLLAIQLDGHGWPARGTSERASSLPARPTRARTPPCGHGPPRRPPLLASPASHTARQVAYSLATPILARSAQGRCTTAGLADGTCAGSQAQAARSLLNLLPPC
jgi:hypothetical protein